MKHLLSLFVVAIVAIGLQFRPVTAAEKDADKAAMARALDQLDALAIRFDADKNLILSPVEQKALLDQVAKLHGEPWRRRAERFLADAERSPDGGITRQQWEANATRYAAFAAQAAKTPAPRRETVKLAMRDGVHLATDYYLPPGSGPFPVILLRTPYHRTGGAQQAAASINAAGMVFVAQDMRGRFDSDGENLPFIGCGWADHQDGVDTVAWIRKQAWCNGKIGTQGASACGITQNLLAATGTEEITAQYISVAAASLYHDATYVGGALRKCQIENWTRDNRFSPKAFDLMRSHLSYDDYWAQFDMRPRFDRCNVPALYQGGWFDTFAQGTIDAFVGRQHHGGPAARGKQKLVMGPWDHGGPHKAEVGELSFPNHRIPPQYESGRWFAHYLKGEPNGTADLPAVAYYVMGDARDPSAPGNQWRQAADWPPPCAPTPYYFRADGGLSTEPPTESNANRRYTFDPASPCPTIGGANLTIPRGPRNQNPIEARSDVLLFTTPPLAKPIEVTGRVRARVFVTTSTPDTDLSIRLCDVYPDGKSYLMAEGMLRLRYRESDSRPSLVKPGEMVEAQVDCWSTSVVFNRNHRIRVTLTSSNYPRFDVNPGNGSPFDATSERLKQTNSIACQQTKASCIVLPVIVSGQGEPIR